MKKGWESVLKDPTATGAAAAMALAGQGMGMQIGPDGVPVLVDNQAQKDLRTNMEEERIKAQFGERERDRTRRIAELQSRILEYEEMRRHRKIAEDNAIVRGLERRVDSVAKTSAEIASQKEQQMKMLMELKRMEEHQEAALKDLVHEKADLILEKSKEEARRLSRMARRPQLPSLTPAERWIKPPQEQDYTDSLPLNMPPPAAKAAAASTMTPPTTASAKDFMGAGSSHENEMEAAVAGTVAARVGF